MSLLPLSIKAKGRKAVNTKRVFTAALRQSLTEEFLDVKFSVFSRRSASGTLVNKPLHVLANSYVVRAASSEILPPEGFSLFNAVEQQLSIESYGYADDSDLEDEDAPCVPIGVQSPIAVHDEIMSPTSAELDITESPLPSLSGSSRTGETPAVAMQRDRFGLVVPVNDMAYKTWTALIFYLYTGEVLFAPLRSQGLAAVLDAWGAPPCSPKSMYRLADKYDLPELKVRAKENIRSKLSSENILQELFSDFSSRYKEIYELEIDYFCKNSLHRTIEALPRWTDILARGELPHSGDMLAALIKKLAKMNGGAPPAKDGSLGCVTSTGHGETGDTVAHLQAGTAAQARTAYY